MDEPVSNQSPPPAPVPPAERRPVPWREALLIGLLALTLNLAGNGRISLWDRDEPRYGGATREMRESGDLIHPTFNAEPRYHKPILIYWLMLVGTAIGGDNPFGARLVSAFAGAATCLIVWSLGRRMFGPIAGRWAALALATAPLMVVESKLATTDATLLFFFVGCMYAVWMLGKAPSRAWTAVFWISLALAVLTKAPAAPALLGASAVVGWLCRGPVAGWWRLLGPLIPDASGLEVRRRLREAIGRGGLVGPIDAFGVLVTSLATISARWLMANWGPLLSVLIAAPWYIAIGLRSGGRFYDVAMGYHVMRRLTTGIETHGGFPGYYVLVGLALLYPWSALAPTGLVTAWRRRKECPAIGFVLGWMIGPLIFLECVQTKIIHYYLPAVPAVALLAGWLVAELSASEVSLRRWPAGRLSMGLLAGIGIAMGVGLVAGGVAAPSALRWPCLVAAVPILAGTFHAVERFQAGAVGRAAGGLAVSWGLVLLVVGAWLAPAADPLRLSPMVAEGLARLEIEEDAVPVLATYKAPGVVYDLGHPAPVLEGKDDLIERVRGGGPVAAALTDAEITLLGRSPELALDVREPVHGFDVEKFRMQTLRMVLVRPSATAKDRDTTLVE